MIGCLSLYCFLVFGPPGVALDGMAAGVATAPRTSIQAYGRANQCRGWTDGCTVCTAGAGEGAAACSTPGIACTPAVISCTTPATP